MYHRANPVNGQQNRFISPSVFLWQQERLAGSREPGTRQKGKSDRATGRHSNYSAPRDCEKAEMLKTEN
jgi:hypothetical protein